MENTFKITASFDKKYLLLLAVGCKPFIQKL